MGGRYKIDSHDALYQLENFDAIRPDHDLESLRLFMQQLCEDNYLFKRWWTKQNEFKSNKSLKKHMNSIKDDKNFKDQKNRRRLVEDERIDRHQQNIASLNNDGYQELVKLLGLRSTLKNQTLDILTIVKIRILDSCIHYYFDVRTAEMVHRLLRMNGGYDGELRTS